MTQAQEILACHTIIKSWEDLFSDCYDEAYQIYEDCDGFDHKFIFADDSGLIIHNGNIWVI